MRKLRHIGLVLGIAFGLLMFRVVRSGFDLGAIALAPAASGAILVMIVSFREACSRPQRRLVAGCWAFAAVLAGISTCLAIVSGFWEVALLLTLYGGGAGVAATFAWRRSAYFRLKFFESYLTDS